MVSGGDGTGRRTLRKWVKPAMAGDACAVCASGERGAGLLRHSWREGLWANASGETERRHVDAHSRLGSQTMRHTIQGRARLRRSTWVMGTWGDVPLKHLRTQCEQRLLIATYSVIPSCPFYCRRLPVVIHCTWIQTWLPLMHLPFDEG